MELSALTKRQLAVGAGAFIVSAYILRRLTRKSYNMPPGPTPLPIVGNLLSFDGKNPMDYFRKMKEKYGAIYTLQIGTKQTVIIASIDAIRESFISRGSETSGRPNFYSGEMFTDNKDIVFGQPYDPIWKLQEKLLQGAIRKFATGEKLEVLVHDAVDKIADLLRQEEKPFNPLKLMSLLVYNIISAMTFGKHFELDDPFFVKFYTDIEELTVAIGNGLPADFIPILKYFPSKEAKMLKETADFFHKFLQDTLDDHRKRYDPENLRDFTDQLLHIQEEVKGTAEEGVLSHFTPRHFSELLSDLFSAGTDTSRFTLSWFILYMAAYPDIQQKMQDELDSVLGEDGRVSLKDRPSLPYTEACLHEVMRIRPIVPLSLPHEATADTKIGEYTIPKGTQIIAYTLAVHHDPNNWPDPEKFDPTRFLDESGGLRPKSELPWIPFSVGKRSCSGEALAKAELHITVATLFQKFSFHAPTGVTLSTSPKPIALAYVPEDYEVVIEERK